MAKVKAPFFGFQASGAIGDALVYFNWKGINAVREYVVPANPRTAAQLTQRGYLEEAVAEWHLTKYNAADKAAWNRLAGIAASARSGFNEFVRSWIDLRLVPIAVPDPPYTVYLLDGGAGLVDCGLVEDGEAAAAYVDWGYSKTALVNRVALAEAPANEWTTAGIVVTRGVYVYARFSTWGAGDYLGYSGIYQLLVP